MTKHDVQISTRITEETGKKLDNIIAKTGATRGEQVRVAINKYVAINDKLEQGQSIAWLPSLEIEQTKKVLHELDKIIEFVDIHGETKDVISAIIDALEIKLLIDLETKHKKGKAFYSLR